MYSSRSEDDRPKIEQIDDSELKGTALFFCKSCGRFSGRPLDPTSLLICRLVRHQDENTFRQFVKQIEDRLERHIERCMKRVNLWGVTLDEMLYDTFPHIVRKAGRFNCTRRAWPWVKMVSKNRIADVARKQRRRRERRLSAICDKGFEPAAPRSYQPELVAEAEELKRMIARLPDDEGTVLQLQLSGESYREISHILGMKQGTVGSKLTRARRSLWRELE